MSGRARTLSGLIVVAFLACAGCHAPGAPTAPAGVPPVDLSAAEPPVVDAIEAASRDATRLPESAIVWGHLGHLYDAHGSFPQAIACYRRALELTPDDFRWNYHLAVILELDAADLDEIVRLFETAARLRPDYTPVAWRHARALSRRGRHEEARTILARAMELDPDFAAGHRSLGQILLTLGDAPGAVEQLERAAELDPRDGTAVAALAQAYRLAGRTDDAAGAAIRARNLKPKLSARDPVRFAVSELNISSVGLARRGTATMNAGRHEAAIPLFERSLEQNPGSSGTHHNLGICLMETGRAEEAVEHFEKSIAIDDDAASHVKLGVLLLRGGDLVCCCCAAATSRRRSSTSVAPTPFDRTIRGCSARWARRSPGLT